MIDWKLLTLDHNDGWIGSVVLFDIYHGDGWMEKSEECKRRIPAAEFEDCVRFVGRDR